LNLASFSVDGGLTSWDPAVELGEDKWPGGEVSALGMQQGSLYVGGYFESVSKQSRRGVVRFDPDGTLSAWAPDFCENCSVEALTWAEQTLYVGGNFGSINGESRQMLAAFNANGELTNWSPRMVAERVTLGSDAPEVHAIAVAEDTVYVAGKFNAALAGGAANLAAADTAGNVLPWNPLADAGAYTLARQGPALFAGGLFRTMCGELRNHVAALDSNGKLTNWSPSVNGPVETLALNGDVIYLGGSFGSVEGKPRLALASVTKDGALTEWDPKLDNYSRVSSLSVGGGNTYVGGSFGRILGESRRSLAAVDPAGNLLPWHPQVEGDVHDLLAFAEQIFFLGNYSQVNGVPRARVASTTYNGTLTDFNPEVNNVYALATDGNTLYLGGEFSTVSGAARSCLAAFDAAGQLLPWAPEVTRSGNPPLVSSLAVGAGGVYFTGEFDSVLGQARSGLAAVDRAGVLMSFAPRVSPEVEGFIFAAPGAVYLGGAFSALDSVAASGLVRLAP
jgi:hypothetical protein